MLVACSCVHSYLSACLSFSAATEHLQIAFVYIYMLILHLFDWFEPLSKIVLHFVKLTGKIGFPTFGILDINFPVKNYF